MTTLKSLIENYIATPSDEMGIRAELFEAIEQHIWEEFVAEPDMTDDRLNNLDVTELAHTMIARADY